MKEILSMIQSLSQSYFRVIDADKDLANRLKNDLDEIWKNNIEKDCLTFHFSIRKRFSDTYEAVCDDIFKENRMNKNEIKVDINNLYEDGFNKLCFWILINN